jgi:hypothetical protein
LGALTERGRQFYGGSSPSFRNEVFGVIETALRAHFAREIEA